MRLKYQRRWAGLLFALALAGCATPATKALAPQAAVPQEAGAQYHIPKTDCEVRDWYNYQVVAIPAINNRWVQEGMSAEERAKHAYEIRHEARVNARFMMPDQSEVKELRERDKQKYGSPDGPTFDYLVKKGLTEGGKENQVYEEIIQSSSRTDTTYNAACQKH
ncbi:MAG: hypothetical protein PHE17_12105 [Thiothrix sp.]|uniref:hypothetical protein n=1 Tax=Thiothrix sp. TaxID=1032 RepID=UPI0026355386|nr:hypothetical protein [Thiothrix sp.]MDD5393753.1 hypothetical protein [Thiothrix sp.]